MLRAASCLIAAATGSSGYSRVLWHAKRLFSLSVELLCRTPLVKQRLAQLSDNQLAIRRTSAMDIASCAMCSGQGHRPKLQTMRVDAPAEPVRRAESPRNPSKLTSFDGLPGGRVSGSIPSSRL